MLQLAINERRASYRRMSETVSPEQAERTLTANTFKALRKSADKGQKVIADALGISTQAWQKYEAGERRWKPEVIETAMRALGVSREAFENERSRQLGRPVADTGRSGFAEPRREFIDVYGRGRAGPLGTEVFDVSEPIRRVDLRGLLGPRTDAIEVAGDSMVPWAEPGELVIFDRDRYPKRGAGCVVETLDGSYFVKLYERSDGSTLFVKELSPEERVIPFALSDIRGVYAVRLRGD